MDSDFELDLNELDSTKGRVPEHNYWKYLNAIDDDGDVKLSDRELKFIEQLLQKGEKFVNFELTKKQQHWLLDIHDRLF